MATGKSSSAMDYIVSRLKKNPQASYASIKDGAEGKGMTIFPVMYGRAKLLLGLVKAGKKKAAKKTTGRGPGRPRKGTRGPGRPRSGGSPVEAVQGLLAGLRDQERANEQLRTTLDKIREMIDRAL